MTSFPKAKIHRFNEDISCAPPPGTYDPKLDIVVKGCPIQKGKRFPDQHCESKSLDNINKSSNTEMCFRTPQVKRRIVKLTPRLQENMERFFDTSESTSSSSSTTNDKIFKTPVSSASRTDYRKLEHKLTTLVDNHLVEINGLNSEIMKLQEALNEVERRESEIKFILKEKSILELERHNEVLTLKNNLDVVEDLLKKEKEANIKYIDDLKSQISLLESEKEDLQGIIGEKQSVIITMNDRYLRLENELRLVKEENKRFEEEMEFVEKKESELINKLVVESENRIELLETTLNDKVNSLESDFNYAQENAEAKFQTHINHITHEFESKILEYKNQLNTYSTMYEKLKKLVDQNEKEYLENVKEVDERSRLLYRELCSVELQRDDLLVSDLEKKLNIIDLQENSSCIEKDLKACKEKCKNYQITLNSMQKTINVLSDRLLETENEVIRLKSVEVELETQKTSLQDNTQSLLANIISLRGSMEKMEQEIITDVTAMKEHLAAKVDQFKIESARKVDLLNEDIYKKQCTIDNLLSELENATVLINKLKCSKMSNEISELRDKFEDCKSALTCAERDLLELKNENRKQLTISEEIIKEKNNSLAKQQQYIDELVSDLVLEKERCEALEAENGKVKTSFFMVETNCSKKEGEIKELNEKVGSMERSLKNLEEKVTVTDEEKGLLEIQLLDAEKRIDILSNTNVELESKITELKQTLDNTKLSIMKTKTEFEVKISCLEVEKNSLSLQLDEAKTTIANLENGRSEKNLIINKLSEQISIEKAKYNDFVSETEKTFETLKRHNEVLKVNSDNGIKLQAAEEKIHNLEEQLRALQIKDDKSNSKEVEADKLRDELEKIRLKLQVVTDERKKLDQELAELMGHQNIHQKIKHINQLKQSKIEIREKAEQLEIENKLLKKKLAEMKENTNRPLHESSQKLKKNKIKLTSSPGVLKDRN